MANYTPKLNLKKPAQEDFVNIDDLNGNSDILDDKLGGHIGAGGEAHKLATATEAGFMSPGMYNQINDVRVIPFSVFYDTITSPAQEVGKIPERTGHFVTPKDLFYQWGINANKHLNTLKVSFDAVVTGGSYLSKTIYVYTTNDDTRVFVNGNLAGTISSTNRGEIVLVAAQLPIGTVFHVDVYSNNGPTESQFVIGSLKNCELI